MELRPLPSLAGGGEVWSPSPVSTNASICPNAHHSSGEPAIEMASSSWLFFFFKLFWGNCIFLKSLVQKVGYSEVGDRLAFLRSTVLISKK